MKRRAFFISKAIDYSYRFQDVEGQTLVKLVIKFAAESSFQSALQLRRLVRY